MSFKSIVRELKEMKDGIGGVSRREIEAKHWSSRTRSFIAPDVGPFEPMQEGQWANLPPELLLNIIRRFEESETSWPARAVVVSSASVCRTWRDITKEIVKTPEECGRLTFPEECGRLTFPISLKQPGPRDAPMQCFIKRDRATSTYRLYFGLTPSEDENDKLMLTAKKIRRATSTDFVTSLVADYFSRASNTYVGKLRSNFLGTKFTIYCSQLPNDAAVQPNTLQSRRFHAKQVSPRLPAYNYVIASISYELNVLRTRGPRRMNCVMHSIPATAIQEGGTAPTPTSFSQCVDEKSPFVPISKGKEPVTDFSSPDLSKLPVSKPQSLEALVLKNKVPRWHEQLQCWCLNFKGRVTVAPVKNSCVMHSIPATAIQEGGTAPTPTSFSQCVDEKSPFVPISKGKEPVTDFSSPDLSNLPVSKPQSSEALVLKNKVPRWHEQLQCWCLNFKGRVTVASVKNFQLVASVEPWLNVPASEQEKVILQFGKIGKDIFTMDYRHPISAFQAFAICLSSFDTKPACE